MSRELIRVQTNVVPIAVWTPTDHCQTV